MEIPTRPPRLSCPTECDDDCDVGCHEGHYLPFERLHDPDACDSRSARGRGPGRLGAWYEVRLFDPAKTFRGRFSEVDFTDKDRTKHVLEFEREVGPPVVVYYGELEAAIPLNPRVRKERGLPT